MTVKNTEVVENEVAATNEETVTSTDVVVTAGAGAVATTAPKVNYIVQMLEENIKEFVEVNEGMDLDFVRAGDWMKLSKKGNYVEAADDSVSYGDIVDVVIAKGEQRFMLWGADGSPEAGSIIIAESTQAEADEVFAQWVEDNPASADLYEASDIRLRYLSFLVPVSTLSPDDSPLIYIMDFPYGDTIGFGKFAQNVFKGKFKDLGIPRKTPVNQVVIRMESEERTNGNKEKYLGTKFTAVGLFDSKDYGIDPDAE